MSKEVVLNAQGFGVSFGKKVVLAELDFKLPARGVTALMGPTGTGKSTLMRSLAWQDSAIPDYHSWGRVELNGQLLGEHNHATLVPQNFDLPATTVYEFIAAEIRRSKPQLASRDLHEIARIMLGNWRANDIAAHLDGKATGLPKSMQKRLAIIVAIIARPSLLMIDEPTSELNKDEALPVLGLIAEIGRHAPVFVCLHNQAQARMIASDVVLLAGGRIQAQCDAPQFFQSPPNDIAHQFVKTGSCHVPAPDAKPEDLSEDIEPPPPLPLIAQMATQAVPEYRGPRGFRWIIPGKVGTSPLPGAVIDINHDLAALRMVGITMLVTLTTGDLPQDILRKHGLRNVHLPVYDREAPTVVQLKMLAMRMTEMLNRGEVLVVHCRAGIGRTGTVVAGWLISEGLTADAALERIRKIDIHYVQTAEQEKFLHDFENYLISKV
ncbi:MAG: ATP-binding cassette domain-containing protein [Methylobacillus sp.]|nr:ATP-binding cassette domain-containing protein [Methylobacillus sp.]